VSVTTITSDIGGVIDVGGWLAGRAGMEVDLSRKFEVSKRFETREFEGTPLSVMRLGGFV
jgi:hypothetical protein